MGKVYIDSLLWENIREGAMSFIKGIRCKHDWSDMGVANMCNKCKQIRYKKKSRMSRKEKKDNDRMV
jgi:hypothetical protein